MRASNVRFWVGLSTARTHARPRHGVQIRPVRELCAPPFDPTSAGPLASWRDLGLWHRVASSFVAGGAMDAMNARQLASWSGRTVSASWIRPASCSMRAWRCCCISASSWPCMPCVAAWRLRGRIGFGQPAQQEDKDPKSANQSRQMSNIFSSHAPDQFEASRACRLAGY